MSQVVPPAGFQPALPPPEAGRPRDRQRLRVPHLGFLFAIRVSGGLPCAVVESTRDSRTEIVNRPSTPGPPPAARSAGFRWHPNTKERELRRAPALTPRSRRSLRRRRCAWASSTRSGELSRTVPDPAPRSGAARRTSWPRSEDVERVGDEE